MDDKSKNSLKHNLGLLLRNYDSLDYIAQEKKIAPSKVAMYKALLSKQQKDLDPIFENLNNQIPQEFNAFLTKVWKGDPLSIVTFIVELLKRRNGNWKDFKERPKIKEQLQLS